MQQFLEHLSIKAQGRSLYDITPQVLQWVKSKGLQTGLLTLYIQHTSASLLINENYDAEVLTDMERFFARMVPDGDSLFSHIAEGPDDMPAHVRSALTQTSLGIPVKEGSIALGRWQGIFLYEHRLASHQRKILLHLIGE